MNKNPEQVFQDFLLQLDTTMAKQMLDDLKDENKRTPQLYNAIGKLLERHKFVVNRFNPEEETLQNLGKSLADYDNVLSFAVGEYK